MPQVENVPWPVGSPPQHIVHAFFYNIPGSQQQGRVEIALNAPLVANTPPGIVKVDAPIHADNIPTGLSHKLQQAGCTGAKMNGRSTGLLHSIEDASRIGLHKALVNAGAERANPTVK